MKKFFTIAKFLCVIFILFSESLICQLHYLEKYPGIPIMAFTNLSADSMVDRPERLHMLKELGVMGFWAGDLTPQTYNVITDSGLKVFPLQAGLRADSIWVVYYTNGTYTKWQAEGKGDGSNGHVELKYKSSIGEPFTEGSIKGIKTISSNADTLIFGPWYHQAAEYKWLPLYIDSTQTFSSNYTILYTSNWRLKIKNNIPLNDLPPGYLSTPVCKIQITDRGFNPGDGQISSIEHIFYDTTLTVEDFLNSSWGNGWDQWSTFPVNDSINYPPIENDTLRYWNLWMQYKILWEGSDYFDLFVDYIEISDEKGRQLKSGDPIIMGKITNLIDEYTDTSKVLGWFGVNEPMSIDNAEPFRIVDSLVHKVSLEHNSDLHLYTTFYTGAGGCYGVFWPDRFPGNGSINRGLEFLERSKLPFLSFNNYMYNDPWCPPGTEDWDHIATDYDLRNINEVAINNLHKFDSAGVAFSYSTQTGTFYNYDEDDDCKNIFERFNVPTPAKMLYHINLGLLYCMRELTCDPFFTLLNTGPCPGEYYREGLVDGYNYSLTELGYTWKDTVAPRMSGLLGKTSRMLTTSSQHLNLSHTQYTNLDLNCIEGINLGAGTNFTLPSYIDFGFFNRQTETEANYFMIINRYYSSSVNNKFIIDFQNLNDYVNWNLRNYVDSSEVTMLPDAEGYVSSPTYTINSGDGILFSASPVVLYGGTLIADEPAGEGMILKGDMIIDNGAVLTIYNTYTAEADIIIKDGSIVY